MFGVMWHIQMLSILWKCVSNNENCVSFHGSYVDWTLNKHRKMDRKYLSPFSVFLIFVLLWSGFVECWWYEIYIFVDSIFNVLFMWRERKRRCVGVSCQRVLMIKGYYVNSVRMTKKNITNIRLWKSGKIETDVK